MSSHRHDTPPVSYIDPAATRSATDLSAREEALLSLVNRHAVVAPTIEAVLQDLFDDVAPVFASDRIGLAFLDESGERLTATHVVANYRPLRLREGYSAELTGTSLAEVIERGSPRLIGDLEQYLDENPRSASSRLAVAEGIRSSMTCPLAVDGRVVGVMFLSSQRKWAFGELEVRLMQAITERLSRVIERAWRQAQVEAANRAYFEMLGFVTHELKSPVAGLVTDARLMRAGYLGPVSDQQAEKLDRMVGRAEHLLGLITEYLNLARIERGDLQASVSDLADVGAEVLAPSQDAVEPLIVSKGMRVTRDFPAEPVALQGDAVLLRIVGVNLLSNAAKYGFEGGEIRVTLRREGDHVLIGVRNEGHGFPEAERGKLFKRFSRLNLPALAREKGTGVGLYTVWRIVRLHGGRVTAASEEGRWAEFTVRLPRASKARRDILSARS